MAHENRKDSGFGGRGFRGDERRGRGGRGSRFGNSERDRSPLRDGRFRDRYADSYHGGGGPRRNYSEAGDFGPRESYYPEPYRRGPYPDPWIGDDQYRRDPYADPYRDHYSSRTPALPPVIECDIFVTDSQLRIYGETVERKIKEHNVLTAVSILPDTRTPSQLVEELTAQGGLFAIFINPQNEIHRSLTLNILHGTPQEHRNMPLDDAIALVGHSFVKYVDDLRERAQASAAPQPSSTANRVFLPPSSEVAYLLNLLADNRAVTAAELNTVIKYLQDRRDKLIDAESRPILTNEDFGKTPPLPHQEQPQLQNPPSQENAQTNSKDITPSHQDLTNKILGLFASAGGNIQGVPPANGTQQPAASAKVPTGTPAPPQVPVPSSASLINFDNPNVQKALDNLIQSTPSLLKNINTKNPLSATPLGAPGISGNIGAMGSGIFGQMGGMAAGPTQGSQPQGQMQGNQNQAGLQVGYGGMQGQRGPGVGQGLSGFSAQSFFNMSGGQGNMGRNYGQPSQPRY